MKRLILIFVLLLIALPAMATNPTDGSKHYTFSDWVGGTDDCLDSVDGAVLQAMGGNATAIVTGTIDLYDELYTYYEFNKTSTATESDIRNIQPDNNGTTGRWIQKHPAFCFGTIQPSISDGVKWFDTSQ